MSSPKGLNTALLLYGNEIQKIKDEYATQIGRITVVWNDLHFRFFVCFRVLLKINEETAKSLWESGKGGDRSQRNMLRSILSLVKRKRDREILEGILNDVDKLGDYRNSLVHSMVEMDYELMKIKVNEKSIQTGHVNRFNQITKNNLFDKIKDDLAALSFFMFLFLPRIAGEKSSASLKRPILSTLPSQIAATKKKIHVGKATMRRKKS